ncbi:phosphotransferase [Streptomyces sp. NPDC058255]|uniref:phosphotransferase n=1 Tax=Streptomyces sp. NPDC058255 TaxID=3346407 RepID=UPI0036EEDF82
MSASLSKTDRVLALVSQVSRSMAGQAPARVTPFPATPTQWATTYRISWAGAGRDAVARAVDPALSSRDAVQAEFALAEELGSAGVGPRVLHTDHESQLLIMEHIPGVHLTDQAATDRHVTWIAELLRRLHDLPTTGRPRLHDAKTAQSIEAARQTIHAHATLTPYTAALTQYTALKEHLKATMPAEKLCHNDLNPTNILFGIERAWLIDFDHAGPCDPFFDLATVILALKFDLDTELNFLARYLTRTPVDAEIQHLKATKSLVLLRYALVTLSLVPAAFDFARADRQEGSIPPPFVFEHRAGEGHSAAVYRLSRSFLADAMKS